LLKFQEDDQSSTRSSSPSSTSGLMKKKKKNTITPIKEEETSFGVDSPVQEMNGVTNPSYHKSDLDIPRSGIYSSDSS